LRLSGVPVDDMFAFDTQSLYCNVAYKMTTRLKKNCTVEELEEEADCSYSVCK